MTESDVASTTTRRSKVVGLLLILISVSAVRLMLVPPLSLPEEIEQLLGDEFSETSELAEAIDASPKGILTIAVDQEGSCPEKCLFSHLLLPSWVRYRHVDFQKIEDLDTKKSVPLYSNLLIITRKDFVNVEKWVQERRKKYGVSVGLWVMGDELDNKNMHSTYRSYDYVIRHFYFQNKKDFYYLRALGNQTCGSSPPLPVSSERKAEPKWGVHWAFLPPHGFHPLLLQPPSSIITASFRKHNCGFIGRSTSVRQEMKREIERFVPAATCRIDFTSGFGQGSEKFKYFSQDLAEVKIGLNPAGNNPECHRLPELLALGTVPAMLDHEYLHATFEDVPGIIAKTWKEVGSKMMHLLSESQAEELDNMSRAAAEFLNRLVECSTGDMDVILRGSFADAQNRRQALNLV